MLYTLPDGREIVLEKVVRVSSVRDQGEDEQFIELSKLSFTIFMQQDEAIEVSENYHFSDWAQKKKKLDLIRKDLTAKWKKLVNEVDKNQD